MEASPDPSPEEIAQRSAEIREAWTDTQRLSRAVGPVAGWLPPEFFEVLGERERAE